MKSITIKGMLFTFILFFQTPFSYGGIISPKELAKIMDEENVVIVSARSVEDYNKVHINGAVNVWHKDLYREGEIKGLLKSPEEIAEILGSKGINEKNTIVVYDGGDVKFAGRLYWIFDYLGCDDVRLLDGQMKMWRKARKPVTKNATSITPTTFNASPNEGEIATTEYVKGHLNDANVVIVDVRGKDEYDGEKGETERKGHIPGAVQFEYKILLNEDATIKSKEELEKLTKGAGITADKEIVLYCETSVRAGIVYLVLKDILKFPKVRVYDDALYKWVADPSNPVE